MKYTNIFTPYTYTIRFKIRGKSLNTYKLCSLAARFDYLLFAQFMIWIEVPLHFCLRIYIIIKNNKGAYSQGHFFLYLFIDYLIPFFLNQPNVYHIWSIFTFRKTTFVYLFVCALFVLSTLWSKANAT